MSNTVIQRWYVVDKDGIATLCSSAAAAERAAVEHEQQFPNRAPYIVAPIRANGAAEGDGAVAWYVCADTEHWVTDDRDEADKNRSDGCHVRPLIFGDMTRPAATAQLRNMQDGATFEDYRDQLAVGNLTPVDQMAFDNLLHDFLAAAIARAEAAEADVRRLDWLDREAHCADWDTAGREVMKRVIQADDGTESCADTWREAIDAAIAAQQAEGEDRG